MATAVQAFRLAAARPGRAAADAAAMGVLMAAIAAALALG